jgi:hypothetical protein
MTPRTIGLAFAFILGLTGLAAAQRSPDTATLDRGDGIPRFGIDFGLGFLDAPPYDAALRIEPYGQYVWHNGFGIYGSLPITRSFGGQGDLPPPDAPNATGIGNFELGGELVLQPSPSVAWVFRGGIALPTASDDRAGALTNAVASFPRLTDLALAIPDATYVRFAVSPLLQGDRLFFRADLGFDLGFADGDQADELIRLNVGGGIDLGTVALGLELVNLFSPDDLAPGEQALHTLAFTIRFMGKSLQPVVAIGAPLDDSSRAVADLFVAVGIQIVVH